MVKPDVLESVARLSRNTDFRTFMEEVQRRRDAARDGLELATDPWFAGRFQGESLLAGELIRLVSEAQQRQSR
jgi:hypothetical protein